jgi:threonine synthase
MVGAQAEGASPIVNGHPVAQPKTVASAIRIGNPASWEGATTARDESGGLIAAVSDTEILSAQVQLASSEGLFAEPASAAPLALLFRLVREGKIEKAAITVVVLTGSGLKDPDAALKNVEPPIELDEGREVRYWDLTRCASAPLRQSPTSAQPSIAWRWRSTFGWRSRPYRPTRPPGTTKVRAPSFWCRM